MRLIRERALSELLNISMRTLQTQRLNGSGIPFHKFGRSVRYDLDVVDKYLKDNLFQSTSEFRDAILPDDVATKAESKPSNRYLNRNKILKGRDNG